MALEVKTDKLKKLLALTTSTNDNEALAAVRKANSLLNESNKSWSEVLVEESAVELEKLKHEHQQLCQNYNLLVNKYNTLISQVVATQIRPQINRPYRRKFNRL